MNIILCNRGLEVVEACPGLGTGEGRMPPERCARQMRRAYDVVIEGKLVLKGGLAGAVRDHIALLE